jgi:hypothetical protein
MGVLHLHRAALTRLEVFTAHPAAFVLVVSMSWRG